MDDKQKLNEEWLDFLRMKRHQQRKKNYYFYREFHKLIVDYLDRRDKKNN